MRMKAMRLKAMRLKATSAAEGTAADGGRGAGRLQDVGSTTAVQGATACLTAGRR